MSCSSPLFRAFEDEAKARLGVVECAKHELLQPFSVLNEKDGESLCIFLFLSSVHCFFLFFLTTCLIISLCFSGEFVAQFKFTVLLMANGPHRITSGPFEPELYKSEHEVQDAELRVRIPAQSPQAT